MIQQQINHFGDDESEFAVLAHVEADTEAAEVGKLGDLNNNTRARSKPQKEKLLQCLGGRWQTNKSMLKKEKKIEPSRRATRRGGIRS